MVSPLAAMPLAANPWRTARWLVLSPHPDDETLGVGALIAATAAEGRLAAIVYLTDGTGSHPAGGSKLAGVRRREAGHALRRLGAGAVPVLHLGWRDAHPPVQEESAFIRSRDRLAAVLRGRRVDALAVTAAHEPHGDHAAAHRLALASVAKSRRMVTLFDYLVWGEPCAAADARRYRTAPFAPGRRRLALQAHRSQLGPSMGEGFRLPPERRRMPAADILYRSVADGRR